MSQAMILTPQEVCELLIEQNAHVDDSFKGLPQRILTAQQFSTISTHATPQGVMAVVKLPAGWETEALPDSIGRRILFLENVQDPGNIGTLIRTAAAFGVDGIVMTDKSADPFGPKSVQATAGSIGALWIRRTAHWKVLVENLKRRGYMLIAAHMGGKDKWPALPDDKIIIALGNEGAGISSELLGCIDEIFTIKINRKQAESLNVAVAGGICMCKATGA